MSGRRSTKILSFVLTGALLAFIGGRAPASAIETTSFGIDVATANEDGRLHLEVEAGETTTGRVKVWNKTDRPLTLQLTVAPAQVTEDGSVSLGGDDDIVAWVAVEPERVELASKQERTVEVRVEAPRKLEGDIRVVAIQAEPAANSIEGGEPPAVIQRLALTTYLEPDEDSLIASLGPYPWIALAILLAVAVAIVLSRMKARTAP